MHYSTFLTLAGAFSLVTASPFERRAAIPSFPPGTVWDIVLDNSNVGLKELQNAPGKVIDIDLLDIIDDDPNSTLIKDLAKTKTVICYFSAGSREEWRKDAGNFTQGVDYGKPLGPEWPREAWVNVKSAEARSIMESRIVRAAAAGCNAVDPDNVDGYDGNQDGFNYPRSAYADYMKFMAKVAHGKGMAIGLKNAIDMIPDVLGDIQFTVNEECHEQGECEEYQQVTKAGKAVFNIEYKNNPEFCVDPANVNLSTVIKPMALDTIGGQC